MSIAAMSNPIAAISGKTALPGLGDMPQENGLPSDFAALLAEQIPPASQSDISLLVADTTQGIPKPDGELLSDIFAQAGMAKESKLLAAADVQSTVIPTTENSAESILAALSPSKRQSVNEPESEKNSDDKDIKSAGDSGLIPIDPGMAAQYIIPLSTPPVQNRLPDNVDRNKLPLSEKTAKTDSPESDAKEGRSALSDQLLSASTVGRSTTPPPVASAAQTGDPRISPRSDSANTAILAGDTNPGNSGNTPAFATALAAAGTASATAASAPPAQAPGVNTALNSPNWNQDFGSSVVWLAKNDKQVAQININPPQLGPVQISISISGDQATAIFASPHQEVRQAIQDSLPQLREMFATAGISLGQANVGSQMPSQNREAAYQFANEARSTGENAILSPDSHASSSPAGIPIQRGRGLIDLFA